MAAVEVLAAASLPAGAILAALDNAEQHAASYAARTHDIRLVPGERLTDVVAGAQRELLELIRVHLGADITLVSQ
ncbi:hypothetical protein [Frankia sp. R82]|uniref:hypothetical protein n=1 Tax=Frankia sp. R82 TaxID=2950553 RepID=UPI00204467F1|nr:hypothetical protein [Frankia sp. R82]MCM3884113.1 hypothetical protein [Frankia sp. R82]